MEQKLQELLDKIQREGVEKGQEAANALVREAEMKAEKIRKEAEKEAADIRTQARKEAEELKRNVTSELQLAARQSINALKQKINHLITYQGVSVPLQKAFSDEDFIKKLIESLISNWREEQNGSSDPALLLPAKDAEALHQYFANRAKEILDGNLHIQLNDKLEKGFRIGPADGGYVISFTDEDFETFFTEYLRPRTKELLYGEQQ